MTKSNQAAALERLDNAIQRASEMIADEDRTDEDLGDLYYINSELHKARAKVDRSRPDPSSR